MFLIVEKLVKNVFLLVKVFLELNIDYPNSAILILFKMIRKDKTICFLNGIKESYGVTYP